MTSPLQLYRKYKKIMMPVFYDDKLVYGYDILYKKSLFNCEFKIIIDNGISLCA